MASQPRNIGTDTTIIVTFFPYRGISTPAAQVSRVTCPVARVPSLRTRDGARGEGAEVEEGGHPALLLRVQLQPEVGHGRVVQLPVVRGQVGGQVEGQVGGQVGGQGGGRGGGRGAGQLGQGGGGPGQHRAQPE